MKKLIIFFAVLFLTVAGWAQSPEKMSYQAVIRNASNQLVTNQLISMKISILKASPAGTAVYIETQSPTSNSNGLISIEIGGGVVQSGTFSSINWADGNYFIKTETDPTGGSDYSVSGTSQLLSVPYAFYAKTAGSTVGNASFEHYVGELFGGGIVVSVWKLNGVEHGLIASLADISVSEVWSDVIDVPIGAAAQSPVDGQANTRAIIAQAGHTGGAAKLCDDYTYQGFADWYLPAAWELDQCYNAAFVVNTILGPAKGFQFDIYWASTEDPYNGNAGWIKIFYNGKEGSVDKSVNTRVRAVRRF